MSDYAPPHIECLESIVGDPKEPLIRQELARSFLVSGTPAPRYDLPRPATRPELVAAVMMVEAHLKAAELGADLGERLVDILYFAREPEIRARHIADGGPGDPWAPAIAEAMLEAGKAAALRLGDASYAAAALRKLELMPCPTCGRAFGL